MKKHFLMMLAITSLLIFGRVAHAEDCLPLGIFEKMTPEIKDVIARYITVNHKNLGIPANPHFIQFSTFRGGDNSRGKCVGGFMAYAEMTVVTEQGIFSGAINLQSRIDGFTTENPKLSNEDPYVMLVTPFSLKGMGSDQVQSFENAINLDLNATRNILTCAPPLVSHWIQEQNFAKQFSVSYGDYEFIRTDVGEPDGKLLVKTNGNDVCEINLSLNPDIYFSAKLEVMVVSAYSGSSNWFEIYRFHNQKCELVGWTEENSKEVKELLSENDGRRTCKK
jgi:hypothetical protein